MARASLKEAAGWPPNRLTRRARAWIRKAGERMQGMACDAEEEKVYISAPLQLISVLDD